MSVYLEQHIPVVKYEGLNTTKDVNISGSVTMSGATTISGATTLSGAVAFTGATTGVRGDFTIVASGNTAVSTADSGKVYMATASSGTPTFTLPNAGTTAGYVYTFINGHASNEVLINPAAGDKIRCKATIDAGASVAPAAGTGIKNTGGTDVVGDFITLIFDGVDTWHMIGMSGIWASQ